MTGSNPRCSTFHSLHLTIRSASPRRTHGPTTPEPTRRPQARARAGRGAAAVRGGVAAFADVSVLARAASLRGLRAASSLPRAGAAGAAPAGQPRREALQQDKYVQRRQVGGGHHLPGRLRRRAEEVSRQQPAARSHLPHINRKFYHRSVPLFFPSNSVSG